MTDAVLKLGDGLAINIAPALEKGEGLRCSLLGKSGSGKTHSLFVLAEEALAQGWPLLIIDPMNNFRHLRQLPYPVIVASKRPSADVHLTVDNAATLAEWFFHQRVSIVIDTLMYEPGEDMQVIANFLQRFWRLVLEQDEDVALQPYAIMIDEAQLFVPQNGDTPVAPILQDLSKRGRQMNIWMFAASQRAASIAKNFLTQVNALICHRVMMGLDCQVVAESISLTPKNVTGIMRKLHKGQALVIADPELLDFGEDDYLIAQVRETSVSFARAGRAEPLAAPVPKIDQAIIAALRELMIAPPDETLNDPQLIEWQAARIRELEAEVKRLREGVQMALPAPVAEPNGHQPVLTASDVWDGRTPLATTRAINRQQRQFDGLLRTIRDHSAVNRRVLVYLVQREGQQFRERDLARFTAYSYDTLKSKRPTGVERLGLVKRTLSKDGTEWLYQSTVREKLAELYPDLDIEALVKTISKLEKL